MPYVIPLTWSPSKDICYSVGKLVFGEAGMHYQSTVAFQYDSQWIETGFAIGADLPLKEGIQYPNGNSLYASPWTGNRSSWFGFMKDHAPGAWLNFLLQKPHLIGLKSIFDEPSPSALDLWLACGHNSQHFSALTLPINPCSDMAFESCGSSKKSLMQVAAFLSDVVDRRFNVLDGALLRLYNLSSNMGGTRPKLLAANPSQGSDSWVVRIRDRRNPNFNDTLSIGLTASLAKQCGIEVVDGILVTPDIYCERRYDRESNGDKRLCLSAASLVNTQAQTREVLLGQANKVCYLDVADIINANGSSPRKDLKILWDRLAFNCLVGNAHDSLSDIWFYRSDGGWRLLPLSAPCATPSSFGFKMLATPAIRQNTLADIETVIAVARYFGISSSKAKRRVLELKQIISKWRPMAVELGADLHDLSALSVAFEF